MHDVQEVFREYMRLERQRTESELSISDLERWTELKRRLNRHFQPELADRHADRRESIRVPVRLQVTFPSYGEMRESLMTSLSRGGLFIATPAPLEIGTRLDLRVRVEESGEELEVPCAVVSINVGGPSDAQGMGVSFGNLDPAQQKGVDELYERCMRHALPPT